MDNDCFNDLVFAYYHTNYRITDAGILLKVGRFSAKWMEFAIDQGIAKWAILTAYNPGSVLQSQLTNERFDRELSHRLKDAGKRYFNAIAEASPPSEWPPEKGYLVEVESPGEAADMAADFGQKAIVYGEHAILPSVVWIGKSP